MKSVWIKWCWIAFFTLSMTSLVQAEQAEHFNGYVAHYNTFNTTLLTPEVARAYGITRSGNLALLNIAVLKKQPEGMDEAVTAQITVNASNLVGQKKPMELIEVQDRGAIYYIGTFRIRDEERIRFDITVQPSGQTAPPHRFRFDQIFYVNE